MFHEKIGLYEQLVRRGNIQGIRRQGRSFGTHMGTGA